jgi:hypothetical protein
MTSLIYQEPLFSLPPGPFLPGMLTAPLLYPHRRLCAGIASALTISGGG